MPEDKTIFNVEVNEEGLSQIRRIHHLARGLFWGTLVVQLVIIGTFLERQIRMWQAGFWNSSVIPVRMLFYPVYIILLGVSSFCFWFYFLRFSGKAKQAINNRNTPAFNDAFRWLYKSLLFSLIAVALNAIEFVVAWYFYFK
ncbi:MAG: hypothetical protein U0U70_11820 [Chitinophagaceae bacterium]